MIYTNFVELYCLLLHAKFQNHRPSGSGEERFSMIFAIYSHGGHLGHVTLTIYTKLSFPLSKDAPHKVWLCLAKRFERRRCLNIMVIYMYIAPWQGQTTPWAQNIFININFLSICSFLESLLPLNEIFVFFPFKCMGDLLKLTLP